MKVLPVTTFFRHGRLSARTYEPMRRESLRIPMSDGVQIAAEIVRPRTSERFPVLLGFHAYPNEEQFAEIKPVAFCNAYAHIEAGDSGYFARRGYVHVVANIRGTGESGGFFGNLDRRSIQDISETIEWLSRQPYCNGRVGMFGMSYFSIVQQFVAALRPPALKAIFAPYGWNDSYRDRYYRGGILVHGFMKAWLPSLARVRVKSGLREAMGDRAYREAIEATLGDPEIAAVPFLVDALRNVDEGANSLVADAAIQPLDGTWYRDRALDWRMPPEVPAYLGGDWGLFGLHLPGAFRAWEHWNGAKRLTIGPPLYLDRPIYQYHEEALRWFDHFLKDNDTGMLDESPVRLFMIGANTWKTCAEWPPREARWTPFFLHQGGVLSEHEFWSDDRATQFEDSPSRRGGAEFWTPPLVEETEFCGPAVLNLYGSTSGTEILWYVSLWIRSAEGSERLLTRGWLRGSQRALDEARTLPWQPVHLHSSREGLRPGEVYEFNIEVRPIGVVLQAGCQLGLRVRCCDDEKPANLLEAVASGGLALPGKSMVTLHHSADLPSHLLLPVTRGNIVGTYASGGRLLPPDPIVASRH